MSMSNVQSRAPIAIAALALAGCSAGAAAPEWTTLGQSEQALEVTEQPAKRDRLSPIARYTERLLQQDVEGKAKLTLVFVLDGMRPDLFNETDTPNMYRLRQEGVSFSNGHAVFPTVTRVNSPSIATGYYPERAGVVGNSIYVPELNPIAEVNTGDWNVLRELDRVSGGRLLLVPSLAERLHAAGKKLAAVSSGSSGSAYLLNHRAQDGVGVLVNGYLGGPEGRVALPDAVDAEIRERFGTAPSTSGEGGLTEPVNWAEEVLREYVLPTVRPDVVLNWITQPDGAHHSFGAGSPEGTLAIRNDDRNIGLILDKLRELGLYESTNVFVISDHGFGVDTFQVNVKQSLVDAGLKAAPDADDVVLASSSQTVSIHVKDQDPDRIEDIVRHLQAQDWTGVLFTKPGSTGARHEGWVPGTFSLDLVHLDNEERGADIVLTFEWSSDKNAFGVAGTDSTVTSGASGPRTGNASGHGSMSAWTVRNTWFAWGVDFKDAIVNRVPASNVDVAPTILALNGIDPSALDGRVLTEAIEGGPDYEKIPVETDTLLTEVKATGYRAVIQLTQVGHQRYIDKSWRLR